jgi:hypothetical protein
MQITDNLIVNKQFLEKIKKIKTYFKQAEITPESLSDIDLYNLVSEITLDDNRLTNQLRLELYKKILDIFGENWVQIPKNAITKTINEMSKLILEKYIEPKPEYQSSFSRNYGNLIIKEWIKDYFALPERDSLQAAKSAVRVFLDMNGVGKLNLIGKPFHTLSKTIGKFVELLKYSDTVKIIKEAGLEYKLSIDGGDEFSLFIYDPNNKFNIFAIMPEIKFSLLYEMENTFLNTLLDKTKMEKFFEKSDLPQIHLSSSFGYTSFWQLINNLSLEELKNKDSQMFLDFLCMRWFDINYLEAVKFKNEYKQEKIAQNPRLYGFLFTK